MTIRGFPAMRYGKTLKHRVGSYLVGEPVTHVAQFIEVKGEPAGERQNLALVYNNVLGASANRIAERKWVNVVKNVRGSEWLMGLLVRNSLARSPVP
jgi:Family of unknown function (DUF5939)